MRKPGRRAWGNLVGMAAWAALTAVACGGETSSGDDTAEADTTPVDTADAVVDTQCVGVRTGDPCDDGNPCTQNDKCIDEVCRGALVSCSDDDPCTDDSCDPVAGCVFTPNTATCDDGNACTTSDKCADGVCAGRPASNLACNDGDPCTLQDVCTNGVCAGAVNDCNDLNPCTQDSCDVSNPDAIQGTGCVHAPIEGTCDDANPCTVQDACSEGACVGQVNLGGACSDGDLCTTGETCQEDGSCGMGVAVVCVDSNPCTQDLCDSAQGCRFPPDIGQTCDDDDKCTVSDTCDADGRCVGAAKCEAANACEDVSCDAGTGACSTAERDCDDLNPCTNDSCDPGVGCRHENTAGSCNDGNLCTTGDHCTGGLCVGDAVTCDVANDTLCRENTCNPASGACEMKFFNGTLCDDGDLCTNTDVCASGECVGIPVSCTDGDPCTVNFCDEGTGTCDFTQLSEEECGDLALERANQYRTLLELPLLLNHEAIIQGATAHCEYYVNNEAAYAGGMSPHNEDPGFAGYTGQSFGERLQAAGYDGIPMFEVMAFINDPVVSVDEWMATLYHRIPFVLPQALEMGYGPAEKDARACDTIDFGENPDNDDAWEGLIIPFPVDGMTGVPTTWDGAENPQPPLPNPYPSGPILTVTFASSGSYPTVTLKSTEIQGANGPVAHVANSESTDSNLCCGIITLYPLEPLDTFTTYTVLVDYARNGVAGTFTWTFTTGPGTSQLFLP
ncbi:MAG: hypothetical protein EP329_26825 [Deltaproteobacteria bacterium]|nr:MAG: hypothetical protein EP329_26825 [Deltaproteobacteria bacterium]